MTQILLFVFTTLAIATESILSTWLHHKSFRFNIASKLLTCTRVSNSRLIYCNAIFDTASDNQYFLKSDFNSNAYSATMDHLNVLLLLVPSCDYVSANIELLNESPVVVSRQQATLNKHYNDNDQTQNSDSADVSIDVPIKYGDIALGYLQLFCTGDTNKRDMSTFQYIANNIGLSIGLEIQRLYNEKDKNSLVDLCMYVSNGIFTSRTLLKILSKRLNENDEIGMESVDNILDQLDDIRDKVDEIQQSDPSSENSDFIHPQ